VAAVQRHHGGTAANTTAEGFMTVHLQPFYPTFLKIKENEAYEITILSVLLSVFCLSICPSVPL
jgi:hypothetical protein